MRDERRRLGIQLVGMVAVAVVLAMYAIPSALPFNPAQLPGRKAIQPQLWVPEGWKFFTRDPREERLFAMRRESGVWMTAGLGPNSRPANLFGLDRRSRAQGTESALILERIPKRRWQDCQGSPTQGLDGMAATDTIVNASPRPTICGDVGFVLQKPVPWAWAESAVRKPIVMPSRIVRVYVICR